MPIRNAGRYTIVILATRTERNGTHIVPTYSRCDRQRETIGAVDGAAQPSEEKIEAQGAEDGDTWIDAELAELELVYPPPSPEQGRALQAKLGLTQARFARRFWFTLDTIQRYEQRRRRPSGPASTLLWVIEADPEAVMRALRLTKAA
jgi:DNA-binding transcriptional regulator YiaG